jgi:hypothetical protein
MVAFQARMVAVYLLDNNGMMFSLAIVPFLQHGDELRLVGTTTDTFQSPRSCSNGYPQTDGVGGGSELDCKACIFAIHLIVICCRAPRQMVLASRLEFMEAATKGRDRSSSVWTTKWKEDGEWPMPGPGALIDQYTIHIP